jgi:hypothetical protein
MESNARGHRAGRTWSRDSGRGNSDDQANQHDGYVEVTTRPCDTEISAPPMIGPMPAPMVKILVR